MGKHKTGRRGHKFNDLTSQILGNWKVLSFHGMNKHGRADWDCQCVCGTSRIIDGNRLRMGHAGYSCGCIVRPMPHLDLTGKVFERLTDL